ncbi:WD repeat-containing protein 35 [Nymphon striatum]|nr:WD repeat-containing protein 35 [Nymphon striatum]
MGLLSGHTEYYNWSLTDKYKHCAACQSPFTPGHPWDCDHLSPPFPNLQEINIPNNTPIRCLSWNKEQGYISCGGNSGLLKVLKLETGKDGTVKGLAAPSNLSMNQTLEGHTGAVEVVTWNEQHQKLTSSDQNGLIIVWMLFKGSWFEEMINNRNKSVVKGMAWNADGHKICIVYEDGAVIVGSVDGNRIWGKELKGVQLSNVEMEDFCCLDYIMEKVHIYDRGGNMVRKLSIQCQSSSTVLSKIVAIEWYNGLKGYVEPNCPCLIICYDNGRLQIMKDEHDDDPVLLNSGITAVCAKWNHNGSMFALVGQVIDSDNLTINTVHFFTPYGEHIYNLKVPGKSVQAATWEAGGLRLALAIDSCIYFANIRPSYKVIGAILPTLLYTHTLNKIEMTLALYSTTVTVMRPSGTSGTKWLKYFFIKLEVVDEGDNLHKHIKHMKHLMLVSSCKDHCILVCKTTDLPSKYAVILSNAIGNPIETRFIDLNPEFITMTRSLVFCASKDSFYTWHYKLPKDRTMIEMTRFGIHKRNFKERIYHIDDSPTGAEESVAELPTSFEGRCSGILQQYDLPHIALSNRYNFKMKPAKIYLNSNSSLLSIIDVTGILTMYNLDGKSTGDNGHETPGIKLNFERKDIWDVKWASDNPDLFAVMEKTRMYVFRKLEPEEPVLCSGYLCLFEDLKVKAVMLDDILHDPGKVSKHEIIDLEVKVNFNLFLLSVIQDRILEQGSIEDATKFIEDNPHPCLWKLLAEAALKKLELTTAENAFVRCKDYQGIQFVKQLKSLQVNLAVALYRELGDWFKVIELLKAGGAGGSGIDVQMEEALNSIGDYYADRQKWNTAVTYYEQGRNQHRLAECYYMLEQYDKLETLVGELPDNHELLTKIGNQFNAVGMCQQAIDAYIKAGKVKIAINCCVNLNQWNLAVNLAKKHDIKEISALLMKYAKHLIDKNNIMQAIELYRKANMYPQAAQLAFKLAKDESMKRLNPLLLKKIYAMAAQLVDQHYIQMRTTAKSSGKEMGKAALTLASMLEEDSLLAEDMDMKFMDHAWKGAEAYHFYTLAQKQLYKALTSCANHSFGICSKAFIKLESMTCISEESRELYEELAMNIFSRHAPKDSRSSRAECLHCETLIPDWCSVCPSCGAKFPICIASGQPIHELQPWMCSHCKHQARLPEIAKYQNCPLCYQPISVPK